MNEKKKFINKTLKSFINKLTNFYKCIYIFWEGLQIYLDTVMKEVINLSW